ncbi:MAG: T9SS type A sorting domain-containing protein [Bacteroidetes bacterium]|nr:T9SS type A sorting domain-containing protein [Bacteroidota bacterium]
MKWFITGLYCLFLTGSLLAQEGWEKIVALEKKSFSYRQQAARSGTEDNCNIIYQRLALQLDPSVHYISGNVTSYFIPRQAMPYIEFDLTDSLQVDSILFHDTALSFTRNVKDVLHIEFPSPLADAQVDSLTVFYQGAPPETGFGSFVQDYHDSVPILWTLSEPFGARDWWPCRQNLSDKIDSLDVIVTTPQRYRAASNGLLVSETQQDTFKTYHWKHRYPVAAYLVCVAVTNYAVYADYVPYQNDSILVLNYVYPETIDRVREQTKDIVPIMQLYNELFGLYPFSKEKYGHAQFGWGGGMEHQTMTFMVDFNFELMAHELAHHWFGDKVTCASWSDVWLNEGFASYLSGLCYERILPEWWMAFRQSRILSATSEPEGSVWCDDTTDVSRIFNGRLSYAKGAMVLHSLRWLLGDTVFFSGMRAYLDNASLCYSFATTTDFKNQMEATSGMNLDEFFTDWVYGKGFPSYQIEWSQGLDKQVNLTIHQTQSHPSVSYFEIPVDISFKGFSKDTTMVFNPTTSGQTYSFPLPYAVDSVTFDPDWWIISANNQVLRRPAADLAFYIYPNPVTDVLKLRVESSEYRDAEVSVFNVMGERLYRTTCELLKGSNVVQIETGKFNSGFYTLRLTVPGKTLTSSFVKLR